MSQDWFYFSENSFRPATNGEFGERMFGSCPFGPLQHRHRCSPDKLAMNSVFMYFQAGHPRKLGHLGAICSGASHYRVMALMFGIPRFPSGKNQAGRQSFYIPFPWPSNGLVEIIDIENQAAIRAGIRAQVADVGVAANLDWNTGCGQRGQIGCHDRNAATKKTERANRHARHFDWHKVRNALPVNLENNFNGTAFAFAFAPL